MSFKEKMSQRREAPIAIFHRFRTGVKNDSVLHLFVEGYDDAHLYERHILLNSVESDGRWKTYVCFGKKNLDKIFSFYKKSSFLERNVLFIRDSDFDFFLGRLPSGANIVTTKGYSVENYVCDYEVLKKYIIAGFGVDPTEVMVDDLIEKHKLALIDTFRYLNEFLGACFLAIAKGIVLDLDNFDIKHLYKHFYSGDVIDLTLLASCLDACGLNNDLFTAESRKLGEKYVEQDVFQWMRGKFILECTCVFLKINHEQIRLLYKQKKISRFNRFISNDFREKTVFEKLSAYVALSDEVGVKIKTCINNK